MRPELPTLRGSSPPGNRRIASRLQESGSASHRELPARSTEASWPCSCLPSHLLQDQQRVFLPFWRRKCGGARRRQRLDRFLAAIAGIDPECPQLSCGIELAQIDRDLGLTAEVH